jgi:F-type H+-transporting ATPase subunit a
MEHGFTWFGAVGFNDKIATALLVAGLLLAFAYSVHRKLSATETALVPDEGVTARNLAEVIVEMISGLVGGIIPHHPERYVPLLATFFVFILGCNLVGLIPGFSSPTSNLDVTLALGAISFVAYHVHGTREHGPRYVKQFLGPVLFLAPLMIVVELFGHVFRPVTLGIRLFANLTADHAVLTVFTDMTRIGVPLFFYALGLLVCVVQAFVFTILSTIYIALAVSHDH